MRGRGRGRWSWSWSWYRGRGRGRGRDGGFPPATAARLAMSPERIQHAIARNNDRRN